MENATKGLMIAASVLIAVILISVGIRLVYSTRGTVNETEESISDAEVDRFNSQFEAFEGNGVRGIVVKQLFRRVMQNNEKHIKDTNASNPEDRYDFSNTVMLDIGDGPDLVSKKKILEWIDKIESKSFYNIVITKWHPNGKIFKIKIENNHN